MYLTSLWMKGDESVCKTRITSSPCSDLNSNYLKESNNHRLWLPDLQSLSRNFSHLLTWLSNRASEHILDIHSFKARHLEQFWTLFTSAFCFRKALKVICSFWFIVFLSTVYLACIRILVWIWLTVKIGSSPRGSPNEHKGGARENTEHKTDQKLVKNYASLTFNLSQWQYIIPVYFRLYKFPCSIVQANQQNFTELFPSFSFAPCSRATKAMDTCLHSRVSDLQLSLQQTF